MTDLSITNDFIEDKNAKSLSFFSTRDVVKVDDHLIDRLLEESAKRGNCDARLCLHMSPEADFHQMIILQWKGHYYRPHKHLGKGDSYQTIRGKLGIFIFDDDGDVTDREVL